MGTQQPPCRCIDAIADYRKPLQPRQRRENIRPAQQVGRRTVMEGQAGTAACDTRALVTAAQAGDELALSDLLSAHLPLVYGVVRRALRGHADFDDVVQETMIRIM